MKKLLAKIKSGNNRIIFSNTISAFAVKGAALVISLLSTPAFIRYFDDNAVLGIWYTLLSILLWFLNFDLGIGNGVRNNLVKNFTEGDYVGAKRTISSGFFSVGAVTLLLSGIGFLIISLLDLNWLYNVEEAVISAKTLFVASVMVFSGVMIRFLLSTVSSVFYALQKSAVNNFLALCVSVLQFVFVLVARFDTPSESLVALSMAYAVIANLPIVVAGMIVFSTKLKKCRPNPKFVDKEHIRKVLGIGSVFFMCQILYMLIMNTNDFLITNLYGPAYTTEYTFYHKLTSLISMVVTLAMTPVWSIITKAMVNKEYEWLAKLYRYVKFIGLGAIVLQFAFIPIQQFVMDIWLGENSIKINYITALAFASFGSVFVYSGILSTIVCGMARMRLQTYFYLGAVLVKFILAYTLSGVFGDWSLIVWLNFIILLPYCVAQQIDLDIYIKKLRNNIQPIFEEKK